MVANSVAKPIQALRIEQRKYYTKIYLGTTLLYAIHHVAKEYADSGEPLEGDGEYFITESGIADIIIPATNRNFNTLKAAVSTCISALRDFRTDICQVEL